MMRVLGLVKTILDRQNVYCACTHLGSHTIGFAVTSPIVITDIKQIESNKPTSSAFSNSLQRLDQYPKYRLQ